jgi:hypothetical protein
MRSDEPSTITCPLCRGSGELVCSQAGEPGHDHDFIGDTTIYRCPRCKRRGIIPNTEEQDR